MTGSLFLPLPNFPGTQVANFSRDSPNSVSSFPSFAFQCSAVSAPPYLGNNVVKFAEAAKKGNVLPLCRCIFSDQLTPILAYRCLVKEDDRETPSFLFDSLGEDPQASNLGRYSIVGHQPSMEIVAQGNLVTIMDHVRGRKTQEFVEDPMAIPRRIMERWTMSSDLVHELPNAFCGIIA